MALSQRRQQTLTESSTLSSDFSTHTTLDTLPDEARSLLAETTTRSFYLTRPWLENYLAEIGDQASSLQILSNVTNRKHCLLFTYKTTRRHLGLSIRYLASLTNFYSSDFAPIANVGSSNGFADLLHAMSAAGKRPQAFDLAYIEDGDAFNGLCNAFTDQRYAVFPYVKTTNWYEPISPGSCSADYLAARPGKLRSTLERRTRKLARDHQYDIRIVTAGAELDAAIADYETIYAKSWKEPEAYPGFTAGLMRTAAAQGWLRLGLLSVDGNPAAAQLWITQRRVAHIFKLAYDPAFKAYSPGSILTAKMADYAIDTDGVTGIDFLNGDDAYKRDWMTEKRIRRGILAIDSTCLKGRVLIAAKRLKAHFDGA